MKITKRELKFDMVLDGEKINSLSELREHPSTELLEMHKDGRLSRWLRTHDGAAEADKLRESTLSGDKAQDLFAVCQALGIDIMLEDIDDALKEEENTQQDTESASSDVKEDDTEVDDVEDDSETDDPTVSDWMEQFEKIKRNIDDALVKSLNRSTFYWGGKARVVTNILSPQKRGDIEIQHIDNTEHVRIRYNYSNTRVQAAIFEGKNIGLDYAKTSDDSGSIYLIFVKGENVIVNLTNMYSDNTCIFAKNIYVSDLNLKYDGNMVLIGENIFIDRLDTNSFRNNAYIFAKNVISIGRGSLIPPFSKEMLDSWISDKTYSCGKINKNDRVYLSAPQYLYGSQKRGNFMHPFIAKKLFNAVKKSYLKWTRDRSFYSTSRKSLEGNSYVKHGYF